MDIFSHLSGIFITADHRSGDRENFVLADQFDRQTKRWALHSFYININIHQSTDREKKWLGRSVADREPKFRYKYPCLLKKMFVQC